MVRGRDVVPGRRGSAVCRTTVVVGDRLAGVAVSTVAIAGSWADAKAGTLVNFVILATAVIAAAIDGPWGLRAEYDP